MGGLGLVIVAFYVIWPASPDAVSPPDNEASPALVVAADAPPAVLDQMLSSGRTNGDGSLRDPADPTQPLDLTKVTNGRELVGVPMAVSTTKLVDHSYTTFVWHFRVLSIGGYLLFWAVMATVFGLLADRNPRAEATDALATGALATGPPGAVDA